jgi:hypothetical protein
MDRGTCCVRNLSLSQLDARIMGGILIRVEFLFFLWAGTPAELMLQPPGKKIMARRRSGRW